MPRSRSRSLLSMSRSVETSWFACRIRVSSSVVLPWSTCAMMAKLRTLFSSEPWSSSAAGAVAAKPRRQWAPPPNIPGEVHRAPAAIAPAGAPAGAGKARPLKSAIPRSTARDPRPQPPMIAVPCARSCGASADRLFNERPAARRGGRW